MNEPRLELTASPHIKGPDSTARIMWSVVASLVPAVAAAIWYFGPSAILVRLSASMGSAVASQVKRYHTSARMVGGSSQVGARFSARA